MNDAATSYGYWGLWGAFTLEPTRCGPLDPRVARRVRRAPLRRRGHLRAARARVRAGPRSGRCRPAARGGRAGGGAGPGGEPGLARRAACRSVHMGSAARGTGFRSALHHLIDQPPRGRVGRSFKGHKFPSPCGRSGPHDAPRGVDWSWGQAALRGAGGANEVAHRSDREDTR